VTPHCIGGVPVPAGPADLNAVTSCVGGVVHADFSWSRSLTAEGYFVDLTLDPSFGGFLNAWVQGEKSTSLRWSGLLPSTTHYYRLYAYNGQGGFHSYTGSFNTALLTPRSQ
jgi:hypothetical protein